MSDHTKVRFTDYGEWVTDDGRIAAVDERPPTHKVVPLSALVIERDKNGEWPEWVRSAAENGASWGYCDAFGGFDENRYEPETDWRTIARAVLDALEAAQKEKP